MAGVLGTIVGVGLVALCVWGQLSTMFHRRYPRQPTNSSSDEGLPPDHRN